MDICANSFMNLLVCIADVARDLWLLNTLCSKGERHGSLIGRLGFKNLPNRWSAGQAAAGCQSSNVQPESQAVSSSQPTQLTPAHLPGPRYRCVVPCELNHSKKCLSQ